MLTTNPLRVVMLTLGLCLAARQANATSEPSAGPTLEQALQAALAAAEAADEEAFTALTLTLEEHLDGHAARVTPETAAELYLVNALVCGPEEGVSCLDRNFCAMRRAQPLGQLSVQIAPEGTALRDRYAAISGSCGASVALPHLQEGRWIVEGGPSDHVQRGSPTLVQREDGEGRIACTELVWSQGDEVGRSFEELSRCLPPAAGGADRLGQAAKISAGAAGAAWVTYGVSRVGLYAIQQQVLGEGTVDPRAARRWVSATWATGYAAQGLSAAAVGISGAWLVRGRRAPMLARPVAVQAGPQSLSLVVEW